MSQNDLSYYEHLTQGSDHGRDTMDMLCDKIFEILSELQKKSLELDDYEGVLVTADFYKYQSLQLFDQCYFCEEEDEANKVKCKVYLDFLLELQRAALESFIYLDTWSEQEDKNFSAIKVLELLNSWDRFLNQEREKSELISQPRAARSFWQYYFDDMNEARKLWARMLDGDFEVYLGRVILMPISKMIVEITKILSCLKYGWLKITETQYIDLTQAFILAARELPDEWEFWIKLFDLAELASTQNDKEDAEYLSKKMSLEAIKQWPKVISSFQNDWITFGKEYFKPRLEVGNQETETISKDAEKIFATTLNNNIESFQDKIQTRNFDTIWNSPNIILLEKKFGKICITGEFGLSRDKIEKLLGHNGWQVTKTISSKTDYLLVGYRPGTKLDEARDKNVKLINWAGLLELISNNNAKHESSSSGCELHKAKKLAGTNWSKLD